MYQPSFEEFKVLAGQGNLIPVYREILADLETPVSAFLKVGGGDYAFLLESVEGGEKWARYCFLGAEPSLVFRSKGRHITIEGEGKREEREGDPLEVLKEILGAYRPVQVEGLPRFYGGAVGYMGYDMVRFFERLPERTEDDLSLPDSVFLLTDTLLIFDHVSQKIKVVANVKLEGVDAEAAYREAIAKIEALVEKLQGEVPAPASTGDHAGAESSALTVGSNFTDKEFEKAVTQVKEFIRTGEVIQVVLAQRLEAPLASSPFDVYRALRIINPSPYMFYLKLKDLELVGSSPEVLVRLEGDRIEVRPIAGTRPRGATEEEDQALAEELLRDEKERAEHIMLVDLGRNDIGRVARKGTVEVNELMIIERYSHVMHIVSNVRGQIEDGMDAFDLMRACFPAGTVSGAPKVRAMEIIEELEPTRRGPYAGAVGYFGYSGNMDTCIAIRTLVLTGGRAYLGVGAGVVADSVPEREYQETLNKARALLRAMEFAQVNLNRKAGGNVKKSEMP